MLGVLNQGIGGNRVLNDAPPEFPFFGPSALARFDREVLAMPGISHLIVFEGINDIGLSAMAGDAAQDVSPDELIAGLRQLAERAHEHGIVAYGATITPYEGTADYFTAEGETIRQAVNDWIRTGGAFDAVIDFDAIIRDPDHPARLLPAYDGGDHLHLNDAGFQAMADEHRPRPLHEGRGMTNPGAVISQCALNRVGTATNTEDPLKIGEALQESRTLAPVGEDSPLKFNVQRDEPAAAHIMGAGGV